MKKFPFHAMGLQKCLAGYYNEHDEQLQEQALLLKNDFKTWLITHFEFTSRQVRYLHSLNNEMIDFLAHNCSYALKNRLPINLIKDVITSPYDNDQGKLIRPTNNLMAIADGNGSFKASGELYIEIKYLEINALEQDNADFPNAWIFKEGGEAITL